ncbi:hydroxyisourate hydrolase [Agromyces marinus]|uniref:5-hydroxyisourate hydrolase n=1 Tax=Agromyces marinus TaxID=1389020 RepID=A0ABN6Y9G2_9MICO|nr:hydroxyisourate hydrolase [Agromyces marinus]UIP57869.1 5-hydroxyisourate hydrolase [Agromyces marinus]BDZ53939.1 5-hydroxyisourate hydrolase [Agromyces marinus]
MTSREPATAAARAAARSRITTHVLDATTGRPAEGVVVELSVHDGSGWHPLDDAATDADGRISHIGAVDPPAGDYRLRFDTAAWFGARGVETFYPEVVLTFRVADDGRHVHAPLLLSPFAYSTYRGS